MENIVAVAIEEYCTAHSSPPSALLEEVQDYTIRNCTDAQMLVGPLEAAFLQLLVRITGARRVLEIGTFTGYSALAMAEALPQDGQLITCENDANAAEIARRFFARTPHAHKIALRFGSALETLDALPAQQSFDLVFLDADKENYIHYYERVLGRVKTGGLIVADNVLWSGRVLAPPRHADPMPAATRAIVQFNDHVRNDSRIDCVMIPMRDGVSVIRKR
jgi:caffeoyl-CoA O-methyltransferase